MSLKHSYTLLAPFYDFIVSVPLDNARRCSIENIKNTADKKILVNGIGSGLDIPYLPSDAKYTGTDITPAMLKVAQRRASEHDFDIELICADSQKLPFDDEQFDIVIMLHPTSPLRKINDIKKSINLLITKNYDSVWTVSETDTKFHPDKQLIIKGNKIKYFTKRGKKIIYRQQLSKVYHRNSNAYIVNTNFFKKKKTLISKNTGAYLIKSEQISIDTLEDLNLAKKYIK